MDEHQNIFSERERKAREDLEAAKILLLHGQSPSVVGMLVSQAIEKMMKGVFDESWVATDKNSQSPLSVVTTRKQRCGFVKI